MSTNAYCVLPCQQLKIDRPLTMDYADSKGAKKMRISGLVLLGTFANFAVSADTLENGGFENGTMTPWILLGSGALEWDNFKNFGWGNKLD